MNKEAFRSFAARHADLVCTTNTPVPDKPPGPVRTRRTTHKPKARPPATPTGKKSTCPTRSSQAPFSWSAVQRNICAHADPRPSARFSIRRDPLRLSAFWRSEKPTSVRPALPQPSGEQRRLERAHNLTRRNRARGTAQQLLGDGPPRPEWEMRPGRQPPWRITLREEREHSSQRRTPSPRGDVIYNRLSHSRCAWKRGRRPSHSTPAPSPAL